MYPKLETAKENSLFNDVIEKFTETLISEFSPSDCKKIIQNVNLNLLQRKQNQIDSLENQLKELYQDLEDLKP